MSGHSSAVIVQIGGSTLKFSSQYLCKFTLKYILRVSLKGSNETTLDKLASTVGTFVPELCIHRHPPLKRSTRVHVHVLATLESSLDLIQLIDVSVHVCIRKKDQ